MQLEQHHSRVVRTEHGPTAAFTMPGALWVGVVRNGGTKPLLTRCGRSPQKPIMRPGRYCTVSDLKVPALRFSSLSVPLLAGLAVGFGVAVVELSGWHKGRTLSSALLVYQIHSQGSHDRDEGADSVHGRVPFHYFFLVLESRPSPNLWDLSWPGAVLMQAETLKACLAPIVTVTYSWARHPSSRCHKNAGVPVSVVRVREARPAESGNPKPLGPARKRGRYLTWHCLPVGVPLDPANLGYRPRLSDSRPKPTSLVTVKDPDSATLGSFLGSSLTLLDQAPRDTSQLCFQPSP